MKLQRNVGARFLMDLMEMGFEGLKHLGFQIGRAHV